MELGSLPKYAWGKEFEIEKRFIGTDAENPHFNSGLYRFVSNDEWQAEYNTC